MDVDDGTGVEINIDITLAKVIGLSDYDALGTAVQSVCDSPHRWWARSVLKGQC